MNGSRSHIDSDVRATIRSARRTSGQNPTLDAATAERAVERLVKLRQRAWRRRAATAVVAAMTLVGAVGVGAIRFGGSSTQHVTTGRGSGSDALAAPSPPPWSGKGRPTVIDTDDRVVVTGGWSETGVPDLRAFVLDRSTGTWTDAPAHPALERVGGTAVALGDGRIVIAGGSKGEDKPLHDMWVGDPSTATWTRIDAPQLDAGSRVLLSATDRGWVAVNVMTGRSAQYLESESTWEPVEADAPMGSPIWLGKTGAGVVLVTWTPGTVTAWGLDGPAWRSLGHTNIVDSDAIGTVPLVVELSGDIVVADRAGTDAPGGGGGPTVAFHRFETRSRRWVGIGSAQVPLIVCPTDSWWPIKTSAIVWSCTGDLTRYDLGTDGNVTATQLERPSSDAVIFRHGEGLGEFVPTGDGNWRWLHITP